LTPENKAAIGTIVVQNLQAGVPFVNIREMARQYAIANGGTESDVNEAVSTAEQTYQQATGMDLSTMRAMGDQLRGISSANPDVLTNIYGDNPDLLGPAPFPETPPDQVNITQLIAQMAARPGGLSSLQSVVSQPQYQPTQGTDWGARIASWVNPFG
jgi:hypothetical protein